MLEALGSRITHLGAAVGAGGYAKLVNQIFVSIHFAAIAEGSTFAQRAGLDVEQLVPALQAGWASSTVLGVKAPQILDRAFDRPIGTVAVQHKDLRYINDTAAELGMELPFSSRLLGMYDELLAEGKAGLDQMALIELFERRRRHRATPQPTRLNRRQHGPAWGSGPIRAAKPPAREAGEAAGARGWIHRAAGDPTNPVLRRRFDLDSTASTDRVRPPTADGLHPGQAARPH
ncbi:MAG: NAD-binding protein [Acidimicrobiales bacterium]